MVLEITNNGELILKDDSKVYKTWAHSDFEEHITPSMFEYMKNYVYDHATDESIQNNCGWRDLEEEAVMMYHNLPHQKKTLMHKQMEKNLKKQLKEVRRKLESLKSFDVPPFDPSSSIYQEVYDFWNKLEEDLTEQEQVIDQQLHEEELWCGGWEEGASDTEGPRYDHFDEV